LFIYGLIVLLSIILVISFVPSFGIAVGNSQLVIIVVIVVLVLFRYFDIIEIPGFLKLSKEIKELKDETKEIKQNQMNMMQAIAVTQNVKAMSSVQIINAATREAKLEAENLLPELPAVDFVTTPVTSVQNTANTILDHVQHRHYSAAFLDLRRSMDGLVRDITGIQDSKVPLFEVLRKAEKGGLISSSLAESINAVRKYGNIAIHMTPAEERRIGEGQVEKIVDLGLRVISELEKTKIRLQQQR
jgi:hypothetical protein